MSEAESPFNFLLRPYSPAASASIETTRQARLTQELLRGDSLFEALTKAVQDLADRAPAEHDVLVEAFGVYVTKIGFLEPNAFLFEGYDNAGNKTSVVAHFSQLVTRVVYLPKKGPDRVVTGFWRDPDPEAKTGE